MSATEVSDVQLAHAVLMDAGATSEEAWATLAQSPETEERLAPQIAAKREDLEIERNLAEARAYAASPEGRAKEAEAALQAKADRERLVEGARVLLERDGIPTAHLTADEVLWEAKIERKPVAAMSIQERDEALLELANRVPTLSDQELRDEAHALGSDAVEMKRYYENFVAVTR